MTVSQETEIELLKKDRGQMAKDIGELKEDVKAIKDFLMGEDPKVVTVKQFEEYKKEVDKRISTANRYKWIFGIIGSIIVSVFALLIAHIIQDAVK